MSFIWKPGYRAKLNAEVVGACLETLQAQGEVSAEVLVKAAKSPSSPLHEGFEWDNRIAGHAYRLSQARQMMASVLVVEDTAEASPPMKYLIAVRPLVSQEVRSTKVYVPLETAMADPERRKEVLAQALRELIAFQHKYAQLQELARVFEAIEQVVRMPLQDEMEEGTNGCHVQQL